MKTLSVQTLFAMLFLSLGFPAISFSQAAADTVSLEEITVQATRFDTERKDQPVSVTRFSSAEIELYGPADISSILERRSSALIRNYGPGGLSNLSMRGYGPGRTQIVWNKFNLNDPVNGVFDLSLMPANFVQTMELSAGNSSTAFGSSASGGTLYLGSGVGQNRYSAWQTLGSFGQNLQGANVSHNSGNWYAGASFQRENSENDFEYRSGGEIQKRKNNNVNGLHGLVNAGYQSDGMDINTTLWLYSVENRSPGSLYFPSQTAVQDDRAIRWANGIEYRLGNARLYSNILYSDADTDFTDEAFGTESETNTKTVSNEIGWKQQWLDDFSTDQSVRFNVNRVESSNFEQKESQFNFAYRLNSEWHPAEPLHLYGGFRYDYYEVAGDALSGSFGVNYKPIGDQLILKGQGSRNFVAPTLNDLYWPDAGNPGLDPETNNKFEGGILSMKENRFGRFESEITGFVSRQYDGIKWVMDPQDFSLSVLNVDEIYSRGFEASVMQHWFEAQNLSITTEGGVNYTKATIEENDENPDSVGDQLVYTPDWTYRAHLSASWKDIRAGADYRHIGERYTTEVNSSAEPLEAYSIIDLFTRVSIPVQSLRINLTGRVHNLTNREFQFIDGYPMPGRYFTVSARIDFTP